MQNHTKNYLKHFGTHNGFIECEVCQSKAVDIHHIVERSKFGKKRKDEQDDINNLIGLCRKCHDKAHSHEYTKEFLTEIHKQKLNKLKWN